ncbi:MAG: hypothetical protein R6V60_21390 [Desulfobacterales bacterium]
MKIITMRRWVYIVGWLFATAILWGANLAKLSELHYRPMGHNASSVNLLRLNLQQLDQVLSERKSFGEGPVGYRKASARLQPEPSEPATAGQPEFPPAPATSTEAYYLPRLSGIIRVTSDQGHHLYSALVEGRLYSARHYIFDFLIEEISSDGILLSRGGRRWFIAAPEVYYSINRAP